MKRKNVRGVLTSVRYCIFSSIHKTNPYGKVLSFLIIDFIKVNFMDFFPHVVTI